MPNYISAGEWYPLTAAEVVTIGHNTPTAPPTAATIATVLSTVRTAVRKPLKH